MTPGLEPGALQVAQSLHAAGLLRRFVTTWGLAGRAARLCPWRRLRAFLATRALPDPMGGVIAADALHRAALAELADRFAIVAPVDRIPER